MNENYWTGGRTLVRTLIGLLLWEVRVSPAPLTAWVYTYHAFPKRFQKDLINFSLSSYLSFLEPRFTAQERAAGFTCR